MYAPGTRMLVGAEVVIDKDRASALLAEELGADLFVMATDVDAVYRGWGTPQAQPISRLGLEEAEQLLASGVLDAGSMRPKVEAAVDFVRAGGSRAIIARLSDGPRALDGATGTTITRLP